MSKTLYIIDGHYQIYRSYYAAPRRLTSSGGEPTGAVHVFCQMLLSLIRDRKPDYLAIAMDTSDKTVFRCDLDPAYKANREPPPEDLSSQVPKIVSIVEALGIPIHRMEGFEADDLMATIAERVGSDDLQVYLVSKDKDLEQLIGRNVRMFDPTNNRVLDREWLEAEKGYSPEQAVEIQTLTGDSTDNIPGVQGVGTKTAAKLIARFGSADEVMRNVNELTPKAAARMQEFEAQMPVTRQLVTLRRDVPITFDLSAHRVAELQVNDALPVLKELELNRISELLHTVKGADSEFAPPPAPRPVAESNYRLIDTVELFDDFMSALESRDEFAFDTETTGVNPVSAEMVGLSFSWEAGEAYYLPVKGMIGRTLSKPVVVERLRSVMEDHAVRKIGHHIKYDVLVLRQEGIAVKGIAFDTMIAGFLVDPIRNSFSMDSLVKSWLDHEMIPITELIGRGRNQITLDHVDTAHVCEYAAEDADYTWRLYEYLRPQIEGSHVQPLFEETEMPLVSVLADMEQNGVAIDASMLAGLGKTMAETMLKIESKVHKIAGHSFNVSSTRQLAEVLFDEQGLTPVRKTKTGRSTDADTLMTLSSQTDNPIPTLVLEYRELSKLKTTYIDTLPKMICEKTGRIHASFHQTGAVTGRLSSSDPNLQNIPVRTETGRRIRAAFVAESEEDVLLVADYSQIELRLLAHFCQDGALMDAFLSGLDIHQSVAAHVNGIELSEVTSSQRSAAKAVNFGIIYGQTAFGLARSLDIPVPEAKSFIEMYFAQYPGIRVFIDECIDKARVAGYAKTILGRRRPIPELHSRNRQQVGFGERIAVNTVVQGSAADLIKRAMIEIHEELRTGDYRARMISQVHDELVFEVSQETLERTREMITDRMEHAIELTVPLVVDVASGRNWAESK